MGAEITFKRPDGGDAKGYLTNAARGDAPGVVRRKRDRNLALGVNLAEIPCFARRSVKQDRCWEPADAA